MCYNHPETKDNFKRSKPETDTLDWSKKRTHNSRPIRDEPYHQNGNNKLHKCDKCLKTFDYHHSMLRHKKFDHPSSSPNSTPEEEKTTEKIVENSQLKAVYININSLISKNRQYNVGKGIKESNADIVFLAETKRHKNSPEFKVQGYY